MGLAGNLVTSRAIHWQNGSQRFQARASPRGREEGMGNARDRGGGERGGERRAAAERFIASMGVRERQDLLTFQSESWVRLPTG